MRRFIETYKVVKECISEPDQRYTFPGGRLEGCDSLFDNSGYEISYCVCSWNLCNDAPLHQQMAAQAQAQAQPSPGRFAHPAAVQPANLSVGTNVSVRTRVDPPEPDTPVQRVAVETTQATVPIDDYDPPRIEASDPVVPEQSLEQPSVDASTVEEFALSSAKTPRPIHLVAQPTAGPVSGLVCMLCGEANIAGLEPECSEQRATDCSNQYPPGTQAYCFTRQSILNNGNYIKCSFSDWNRF